VDRSHADRALDELGLLAKFTRKIIIPNSYLLHKPVRMAKIELLKKLEKGRTAPNVASQQQRKQVHHKKEERNLVDEKLNMHEAPT
jgi:hypothetical protein